MSNIPKTLNEAYLYIKQLGSETKAFVGYGDFKLLRLTGATSLEETIGTETDDSAIGDVVYVLALTPVRSAAAVKVNATDTATFAAGDPQGKMIKVTLAAALATSTVTVGTAGDRFAVLKDPDLSSSNTKLIYVSSFSGSRNEAEERQVRDGHGNFKGVKKLPKTEPGTISLAGKYSDIANELAKHAGHRVHLLALRDDNEAGTITETTIVWGLRLPAGTPSESTGDNDSEYSTEGDYVFMGTMLGS